MTAGTVRHKKHFNRTCLEGYNDMPHAGLMDEDALGPVFGPLQRARLHIRGGMRRLRQGKTSAGIVTLFDALHAAVQWYIASHKNDHDFCRSVLPSDDLTDDRCAYELLVRSGVLDGSFDYASFDRLVDCALAEELEGFDPEEFISGLESVMTALEVMPFNEEKLPPEDPATY